MGRNVCDKKTLGFFMKGNFHLEWKRYLNEHSIISGNIRQKIQNGRTNQRILTRGRSLMMRL